MRGLQIPLRTVVHAKKVSERAHFRPHGRVAPGVITGHVALLFLVQTIGASAQRAKPQEL